MELLLDICCLSGKTIFQSSGLSAFDENFEELKDDVINENDDAAVDCVKGGSIGLIKVISPASHSSVRFYPPNWLDESDDSKWLEESIASERMDVPNGRSLRMRLTVGRDLDEVVANAATDCSVDLKAMRIYRKDVCGGAKAGADTDLLQMLSDVDTLGIPQKIPREMFPR